MQSVTDELLDIEARTVEEIVGTKSFERGRRYVRAGRVLETEWDASTRTLTGTVVGNGATYSTAAFFAETDDGSIELDDGECTCPVGWNCKHVAAIVLASVTSRGALSAAVAGAEVREDWEQPLRSLLRAPQTPQRAIPLAIELSLSTGGATEERPFRLSARLMREGARGNWINGSLTWSRLDSWQVTSAGYHAEHLLLARKLYALEQARRGGSFYSYGYGSGATILDLTDCDSAQLWLLFEEGRRVGLPLVHCDSQLGDVRFHPNGEVLIDVTCEAGEAFSARAVVQVNGEEIDGFAPITFIGGNGDAVLLAEQGEPAAKHLDQMRMRLIGLSRPTPAPLQKMVLDRRRLEIPAAQLQRFAEEICPSLASVAPVVSSDDSFQPPKVSAPTLTLRAAHGPGHALEVGWAWAYKIGASVRHVPLDADGADVGFRDPEAERSALDLADLSASGLERFSLLDVTGRPTDAKIHLSGVESMRFTTEQLPSLTQLADVAIEVAGRPADYRDVSRSLTVGLSTGEIANEPDWFDLGVSIEVEGSNVPFADVFVALASGETHMLLDDGAHFSLLDPRLQELRRLIEEARELSDSPAGSLRISRWQASLWEELVALGVVREQAESWRRQVDGLLSLDALRQHQPPPTLDAVLRPYQQEGFSWLATLWDLRLGGILADEMGLGKTLQVLSLICHAKETEQDSAAEQGESASGHAKKAAEQAGPFLVVAPTSVVSGWVAEAARFAPQLTVGAVTDTFAKSGLEIEQVARADIVVTTYTLLRLEAEAYKSVSWAGLVLDEAQYVKNHQSKTYKCVRELVTPFKLALTGTPMENNLMELWSLLSIAAPGLFPDPKRFATHYGKPIERAGDSERLAILRRRIKPLIKRRTKELVAADLPSKQEQTLAVELHPRHRRLYDKRLQRERQKILGLLGDFDRNRFTILRSITLLRQLSLHSDLVEDGTETPCAKLNALVEQLSEVIDGGHRALVFSQFTGFLGKARERLDAEGISYCYLDGRTRSRDRVLSRFKEGVDPVFLISLKAGGFGLNLTEADYCFLLDPWWNPATEAQAIDRTHRIGQTRPVNVYRLISKGTIEEKVLALARRKAALFRGVMDDGDLFASSLSAEDIRGLLS